MRRSVATLLVLAGFGALVLPAASIPSYADPDQATKLKKLTKQAADLNKAYRGEIIDLEDTRKAAEKADKRVKKLKGDLSTAKEQVAQFAQTSYMGAAIDGIHLFTQDTTLDSAADIAYLSNVKTQRLASVQWLLDQQKKASKDADKKISALQKNIKDLQSKRREVESLLAKFGFQTPDAGSGLTPRMITVRDAIMREFPMPFGVGCLRPGDPGEHGKGRACDFMMSSGGRAAAADAKDRGDAVAQWCIDHHAEYGIMYIIWQQRFYDMRTGTGWRPMADRGGITANHYDHVHVSVL
ncbi:hypothetical protein J5X84_09320 [Streptosporangiaceae bacterium NEAU-GS5]|nr:hypothetical protein [Streptosporangiaceae bacterium NEAU-GS5]